MADENNSSNSQEINFLKEKLNNLYIKEGHCFGYFVGEEKQFEDFLDHFQMASSTCFIRAEYHSKERGHKRMSLGALPVFEDKRGNVPIETFGYPFTVQSKDVRHCLHGSAKDSRGGTTRKRNEAGFMRRRKERASVKRNCMAIMHVRGIQVYKEYFVDPKYSSKNKFKKSKTKALKNIQSAIQENANHPFTMERRFYVKIPLSCAHSGHLVGECLTPVGQKIDEQVENKIYDLVRCNVTNVAEIKRCLTHFVKDDLFGGVPDGEKPKKGNKRFYPRKSDIRTHVSKAISSVEEVRNVEELAVNLLNTNPSEWDNEPFANNFLGNDDHDGDGNGDDHGDDHGDDPDDGDGDDHGDDHDDGDGDDHGDNDHGDDDDHVHYGGDDDDDACNDDVASLPFSVMDERTFLQENLNNFHANEECCFGYLVGEEKQLENFLDHLQLITSTCFIRAEYHSREKGHKRMSSNSKPIFEDQRGNVPIQMFGNPFLVISNEVRHCLHGSTKNSRGGLTRTKSYEHDYSRTMRKRGKSSIKRNCTATIQIRGIQVYKDYSVDPKFSSKNNVKRSKTKALKNIQNALEENANHPFTMERRFYVKIPLSCAHNGHLVGESLIPVGRKIDERVENKIYDLVRCNVTNVAEIKRCLTHFVKDDLFGGVPDGEKPKKGNKRFYPRKSDIRTRISEAIKGNML